MSMRRVEIAGGGIGGLAAATALARRGWQVRVHERADDIRAIGSGIFMGENALRVLEAIGAFDEAVEGGTRHLRRETRDRNNKVIGFYTWPKVGGERVYIIARARLIGALRNAAERAGATVVTGSKAVSATPDGTLVMENGNRFAADLVIGADGVHSRIRQNSGIPGRRVKLNAGAIRAIVPQLPTDRDLPRETFAEYWCGKRRFFYAPISPEQVFVALMTMETDTAAARDPIDKTVWKQSFPFLAHMIDRIEKPVEWASFIEVKLKSWHRGRLVLIGDAAHAMAPNFGQGGATAMMDAVSLAANLDEHPSIDQAILRWEQKQRPVISNMQLASRLYGAVTYWPTPLQRAALWAMNQSSWVRKQRTIAFDYVPDGVVPQPARTAP